VHADPAADIVTRPNRSIIRQSYDARERLTSLDLPGWLNGDGFGIGAGTLSSPCSRIALRRRPSERVRGRTAWQDGTRSCCARHAPPPSTFAFHSAGRRTGFGLQLCPGCTRLGCITPDARELRLGKLRAPPLTKTNLASTYIAKCFGLCAGVERRAATTAAGASLRIVKPSDRSLLPTSLLSPFITSPGASPSSPGLQSAV